MHRGIGHMTPFRLVGRDDRVRALTMFGVCFGFLWRGGWNTRTLLHIAPIPFSTILLYLLASLLVFQTDLEPRRLVAHSISRRRRFTTRVQKTLVSPEYSSGGFALEGLYF